MPASIKQLSHLEELDISYCWRLQSLPELPPRLEKLHISYCWRLQSLPELPPCLEYIDARHCISLRTVSSLNQLFQVEPHHHSQEELFAFYNCFRLGENEWNDVSENALSRIQRRFTKAIDPPYYVNIAYAGSEIPKYFAYRSIGPSITIKMPPYSPNNSFLGFALCVVVSFGDFGHAEDIFLELKVKGHFKNGFGDFYEFSRPFAAYSALVVYGQQSGLAGTEHVLLWYNPNFHLTTKVNDWAGGRCYDEASFEFEPQDSWVLPGRDYFKVTKCAVHPLYAQQDKECSRLEMPAEVVTRRTMNLVEGDGRDKMFLKLLFIAKGAHKLANFWKKNTSNNIGLDDHIYQQDERPSEAIGSQQDEHPSQATGSQQDEHPLEAIGSPDYC